MVRPKRPISLIPSTISAGYGSPYSGGPSYPVTPAPTDYSAYPATQPAYPQQGYQTPYTPVPQNAGTNTMAILALVFAFVFAPLGIVFGHMGRSQIKKSGEQGDGL